MKTHTTPPTSSSRLAFFLTRLWLACLVIVAALAPARGANTFVNTGALGTARGTQTSTLLPNGKVLVAGGLSGGNAVASAETYEPSTGAWTATGSLATARYYQTATMLPNGKVLVAGGFNASGVVGSAELYDPVTGTWSATGSLATARSGHTATLLASGMVLVAGGYNTSALASAELYDFTTGTWTATGPLANARQNHTATLLPDGKVLVAAGAGAFSLTASAELFDPAGNGGAGAWTATGSLATARYLHTATLLPSGKVLVAGGEDSGYLASAQLYDPAGNGGAGSWSATGAFTSGRSRHTAALLPNGKVIIAGGFNGTALTSAQIYDPAAGTWSATGALVTGRYNHTATLLPDGRMLVAGSATNAELYDPAAGAWSATGTLVPGRREHTATLLPNGKVIIAGGFDGSNLTSAQIYDPSAGTWSATGEVATARRLHTATLLANGKILVAGGISGSTYLASAELYDPATGSWSVTGTLATGRHGHTATLLPNGKVLVAGGYRPGSAFLSSAELYDPATGTWSTTGALDYGNYNHTATLLPNGKVLVVGINAGELYDPTTGTWSITGWLAKGRFAHTATLLLNGKVLVAGGIEYVNVSLASAELYDPATGLWTATGALGTARGIHTATLLPNGRVLVAGGFDASTLASVASAELYDPATATWSAGPLATARHAHTATLLLNGKVLVAGGYDHFNVIIASAELYAVGLGFSAVWQPQITSASFDAAGKLVLAGAGFRGISGASGGNGAQDSPTDYPVVQLRRLDNEQSVFLLPDPAAAVSATGFTSAPVVPFSGYALATVLANGIPSAASVVFFPTPDIGVFQPVSTGIVDGGTKNFGAMFVGSPVSLAFTIRSAATADLTGLTITKDGVNAADFTVTASPTAPVPPGGSTTFTIEFAPTTSGTKTAAIHIANNVAGKNPYDIHLTGQAYSFTTDTDGDGLNDASEYQMAALGFDWQVSQPAMVSALFSNANGAGLYNQAQYDANLQPGINAVTSDPNAYDLYTLSQVQALHIGTPLLTRNPANGQFTLTIGVQKATDLINFTPFPMTVPQTFINAQGKLEFTFGVPDDAAFFRLQSH